jgi:DNA-binding transcriptional LysR family regulator
MRRPKVKLDNLITFMTVAATHNIDNAADELGLSASGVRRQLENIEEALGIRMFEGGRGRLVLTEDGESFREDARKAVDQVLLAEEQLAARRAIRNHHLVIGHSTNLPPRMIAAINQIHIEDNQLVHIEHRTGLTSTTIQGVIEGSLHAGFGVLPIRSAELLVRTIFEEPLVACLPSGHRLAARPAISPQDLDGEPMIAVSRGPWPERHQEIEEHFSDFGVVPRIVVDAYSAPEAIAYVEQKVGICLLAGTSITGRPGVAAKPLTTRVLMRRSGIFIREDNRSPLLQKLLEISFLRSDNLYVKQGPSSATTREQSQKVKRIS